jgi:chromosome segregation ATPase
MKTDTKTLATFLRHYNAWRRGDESLEQPHPKALGELLDESADRLEQLERELADNRVWSSKLADVADDLRADLADATSERDALRKTADRLDDDKEYNARLCESLSAELADLTATHDQTERDLYELKAVLADPAEVELAMIRGDIAIPKRAEFDVLVAYQQERALADGLAHWLSSLGVEDLVPDEWSVSVTKALFAWKEARDAIR